MNNNLIITILLIGFMGLSLFSCSERKESNNDLPSSLNCDSLYLQQGYVTLTGTLVINSKGEFAFRAITDDSLGIACPTFLIPCSNGVDEYIEGQYIAYSSIRDIEDDFWISISGKYVNLDHYKNQDENFKQLEFLYDWVAIVDSPTETHALNILDSINSIDQNDLIKINAGRCVNNCLPKERFYKLVNLTEKLNKIGYDVIWQTDSLNYELVQFVK